MVSTEAKVRSPRAHEAHAPPRPNPRQPASARAAYHFSAHALSTYAQPIASPLEPGLPYARTAFAQLQTPWHLARLGTWHALALGTCVLALVRVFARSWRASPGSVTGACVIRFVMVAADRPGALALGTPWHLARLGTWHVFVVIVLPWIMPARLVFSSCVLAARARRACPSAPVCQTRLSLGGRPGTWLDLALGTRVEQFLHRCFAGTHALQHTLGRCMWCCGLVPIPARAGMGWIPPLNGCSPGLVVRGVAPCTLSYICHTKVFSKVSNSLPIHQYFHTASPYGAQSGGWIGMTD